MKMDMVNPIPAENYPGVCQSENGYDKIGNPAMKSVFQALQG